MKQKLLIALCLVLIVVAGALVYTLVINDSASAPSPTATNAGQSVELTSTKKTVAIVGTVTCLAPVDDAAIQAGSCAIGLQQDDGGAYDLHAEDPTTTGTLPTGQRVKVTGVISPQSSKYKANGIIEVQSVKQL